MTPEQKKVYCKECKYLRFSIFDSYRCVVPADSFLERGNQWMEAGRKNGNNDCKDFVVK
jgi:hypothetical protein